MHTGSTFTKVASVLTKVAAPVPGSMASRIAGVEPSMAGKAFTSVASAPFKAIKSVATSLLFGAKTSKAPGLAGRKVFHKFTPINGREYARGKAMGPDRGAFRALYDKKTNSTGFVKRKERYGGLVGLAQQRPVIAGAGLGAGALYANHRLNGLAGQAPQNADTAVQGTDNWG